MGDPNGIGPEVMLKALEACQRRPDFRPVVAGAAAYLESLAEQLDLTLDWDWIELCDVGAWPFPPRWGEVSPEAGRLALLALERAVELCGENRCRALVTAPVSKEALRLAGFGHSGHTDYLADAFDSPASMAFLSERFHVLLATAHIPLRDVAGGLCKDDLVRQGALFYEALATLGGERPRIAVCGLNPHASERGLIGDEEERVVEPAVRRLQERFGPAAFCGPLPADTVFWRIERGDFDAALALYHDQGLIPLKMAAFETAVNVTLGLPVVRTSPDHGTAFDIAGSGRADPGSMRRAFQWAVRLLGDAS